MLLKSTLTALAQKVASDTLSFKQNMLVELWCRMSVLKRLDWRETLNPKRSGIPLSEK